MTFGRSVSQNLTQVVVNALIGHIQKITGAGRGQPRSCAAELILFLDEHPALYYKDGFRPAEESRWAYALGF